MKVENDYFDKEKDSPENSNQVQESSDNVLINNEKVENNIEESSSKLEIDKKTEKQAETDNMFTFGEEDLDVPTFLRNNN